MVSEKNSFFVVKASEEDMEIANDKRTEAMQALADGMLLFWMFKI